MGASEEDGLRLPPPHPLGGASQVWVAVNFASSLPRQFPRAIGVAISIQEAAFGNNDGCGSGVLLRWACARTCVRARISCMRARAQVTVHARA
eukprot:8452387-Pyramimonas_sp.AAC.1